LNSNVIFFVATFSQLPETVTAFSVLTSPQGITPFFLPPAAADAEVERRRNHATETKYRDRFETTPSDKTRIEKRPRINTQKYPNEIFLSRERFLCVVLLRSSGELIRSFVK
jgi:hypothetical protein